MFTALFCHFFFCADKLDDIRSFRKRKRHHSEIEDEEEKLSLTEYLARKMAEDEKDQGPSKKKRVSFILK